MSKRLLDPLNRQVVACDLERPQSTNLPEACVFSSSETIDYKKQLTIAAGTVKDWFKWAKGEETPMHHGPPEDKPAWTRYLSVDYSHKVIGVQYTVTGILLLLFAGALAISCAFTW